MRAIDSGIDEINRCSALVDEVLSWRPTGRIERSETSVCFTYSIRLPLVIASSTPSGPFMPRRAVKPAPTRSLSIKSVREPLAANDSPSASVSDVFPSPELALVTANARFSGII